MRAGTQAPAGRHACARMCILVALVQLFGLLLCVTGQPALISKLPAGRLLQQTAGDPNATAAANGSEPAGVQNATGSVPPAAADAPTAAPKEAPEAKRTVPAAAGDATTVSPTAAPEAKSTAPAAAADATTAAPPATPEARSTVPAAAGDMTTVAQPAAPDATSFSSGTVPPVLSDATNGSATTQNATATSFRDLIDPETMPPFWFLVLSNCFMVVAQSAAFGFDLKFSDQPSCFGTYLAPVVRPILGLTFVAMALCAWRKDLMEISTIPKDVGWFRTSFMVLVVWVTSPNYRAAKALFASLSLQSPMGLLAIRAASPRDMHEMMNMETEGEGTPKNVQQEMKESLQGIMDGVMAALPSPNPLVPAYATIPLLRMPVGPCTAHWLPWYKWLYMIVLAPYILVEKLAYVMEAFSFVCPPVRCWAWCVTSCCLTWHQLCCCWWLFLVIITLGLWGGAKSALGYEWNGYAWPILELAIIQSWAMNAPGLFGKIYLCIIHHKEGVKMPLEQFSKSFQKPQFLEAGRQKLAEMQNATQMNEDFGTSWSYKVTGVNPPEDLKKDGLQALKVDVVQATLGAMTMVPLTQIITIFVARALFNSSDVDGYIKAVKDTVGERQILVYLAYVKANLISTHSLLTAKMSILWNLL